MGTPRRGGEASLRAGPDRARDDVADQVAHRPAARRRMTDSTAPVSQSRRTRSSDSSHRFRFQTGSPLVRATLGSISGRSPVEPDLSLHQNSCCEFHYWLCFFTFFTDLPIMLAMASETRTELGPRTRRHLRDFRHIRVFLHNPSMRRGSPIEIKRQDRFTR